METKNLMDYSVRFQLMVDQDVAKLHWYYCQAESDQQAVYQAREYFQKSGYCVKDNSIAAVAACNCPIKQQDKNNPIADIDFLTESLKSTGNRL